MGTCLRSSCVRFFAGGCFGDLHMSDINMHMHFGISSGEVEHKQHECKQHVLPYGALCYCALHAYTCHAGGVYEQHCDIIVIVGTIPCWTLYVSQVPLR